MPPTSLVLVPLTHSQGGHCPGISAQEQQLLTGPWAQPRPLAWNRSQGQAGSSLELTGHVENSTAWLYHLPTVPRQSPEETPGEWLSLLVTHANHTITLILS